MACGDTRCKVCRDIEPRTVREQRIPAHEAERRERPTYWAPGDGDKLDGLLQYLSRFRERHGESALVVDREGDVKLARFPS